MNDAIKETVVVFGRLARPGDTVEPKMATGEYRSMLARMLSRRGLALRFIPAECGGEWLVEATIAWGGK